MHTKLSPCRSFVRASVQGLSALAVLAWTSLFGQSGGDVAAPRASIVQDRAAGETALPLSKTSSAYKLAVTDLLAVTVYQEPDLSASVRVAEDGSVVLPLLGPVKLGGLSVREATTLVTNLYNKDYLVDPVVTLTVMEATKGKVTVLGAVNRPGIVEVPIEGAMSIIEVIAMAGGYARVANESKITVKRSLAGKEEVFKVNGKEQASSQQSRVFMIRAGDVITVAESLF